MDLLVKVNLSPEGLRALECSKNAMRKLRKSIFESINNQGQANALLLMGRIISNSKSFSGKPLLENDLPSVSSKARISRTPISAKSENQKTSKLFESADSESLCFISEL
jgi:hypothetical protein